MSLYGVCMVTLAMAARPGLLFVDASGEQTPWRLTEWSIVVAEDAVPVRAQPEVTASALQDAADELADRVFDGGHKVPGLLGRSSTGEDGSREEQDDRENFAHRSL